MKMANEDLRKAARKAGIPLWRIADTLGVSEPTMTRRLRRELPEGEKQRILEIIEQIRDRREE